MASQGSSELFDSSPNYLRALESVPLGSQDPGVCSTTSPAPLQIDLVTGITVAVAKPASTLGTSAHSDIEACTELSDPVSILGKRTRQHSTDVIHELKPGDRSAAQATNNVLYSDKTDLDIYGAAKFGGLGEYMSRKRAKLQIQNSEIAANTELKHNFFKGVRIYVNGHTEPPLQELRAMLLQHGGEFHAYLDKKGLVTHVVASQLTPAKWKEYQNLKVVTPSWIVESARGAKLLPWRQYRLEQGRAPLVDASEKFTSQQVLSKGAFKQHSIPSNPSSLSQGSHLTDPLILSHSKIAVHAANNQPILDNGDRAIAGDNAAEIPKSKNPSYAPNASNVEAARLMVDPKWRAENTSAGGETFVDGFFKRSRLHHLSTWKSELQTLVRNARLGHGVKDEIQQKAGGVSMRGAELVMNPKSPLKAKTSKSNATARVIMHCDFDCFFVSAGLVKRPQLKGKAVVVCHAHADGETMDGPGVSGSTSEIASASYEARSKGVKNGMSLSQARQLCPEVKSIPYEFETYRDCSIKFYNVLLKYADNMQVTSVDEAVIEVTDKVAEDEFKYPQGSLGDPVKRLAEQIRNDVRECTSCEVSVGIGDSLLLARLATRIAKPAGSYYLKAEAVMEHLAPLSLDVLPGIGYHTLAKIEEKLGIKTCGEAFSKDEKALQKVVGDGTGTMIYQFLRGIDKRDLKTDLDRKTVSASINYAMRFESLEQVRTFIFALGKEVALRLDADSLLGRQLTLNIMRRRADAPIEAAKFLGHGICDKFAYRALINDAGGTATADPAILSAEAWRLIQEHHAGDIVDLRGIGISITQLESVEASTSSKQAKLNFAKVDKLRFETPELAYMSTSRESSVDSSTSTSAGAGPSRITKTSPKKGASSAQAIIRQLASPRSKLASMSPVNGNYGIFKKREGTPASIRISDNELRELGIDVEIFRCLPSDIQQEQVTLRRNEVRALRAEWHSAASHLLSAVDDRGRSRSRSISVVPAAPPLPTMRLEARFAPVLTIKKASSTEELQNLITRWVDSGMVDAPEHDAVVVICDFLVRCLDEQKGVALEKVVAVMAWWRYLCRSRWSESESKPTNDQDEHVSVGLGWWRAFYLVKDVLDDIVQQRFGGTLSLG